MYPPDHDFIFFRVFRFLKIFFINISMNRLKPKQTFCIPNYLLKDGWMFLQHWAKCWCRWPSIGQTISAAGVSPPCLDYKTPISGDCFNWSHRPRRGNIADLFCLHGNIRPGNITIPLFFGALRVENFNLIKLKKADSIGQLLAIITLICLISGKPCQIDRL